jgi:hypothetical protein
MKKALLLVVALTFASTLSSCGTWMAPTPVFVFNNVSSYTVDVRAWCWGLDTTFTLTPGGRKQVEGYAENLNYTYSRSDLLETGGESRYYYFWDKGSPQPF